MSSLELKRLSFSFGERKIIEQLDLQIRTGEFVAIIGPSGCGKSTLLSILAGHLTPTQGSIQRHENTRMVFQQNGLLPWLNVKENIALGLRHIKNPTARQQQLQEMLHFVRLHEYRDHYPPQLSGGMRQRAEIGRALIGAVDALLMDEPLSSLDSLTRIKMRDELAGIFAARPRTVVLVTHDVTEASQLADRILIVSGTPLRIVNEVHMRASRPRSLTHPEVVKAVHVILTHMGFEQA